jgi:predicted nuclease with TOPRIM domain
MSERKSKEVVNRITSQLREKRNNIKHLEDLIEEQTQYKPNPRIQATIDMCRTKIAELDADISALEKELP